MKKKRKSPVDGFWWTVAAFVLVLSLVLYGLQNTDGSVDASGRKSAEEAVRRAAVTCYALEGSYPESYEYLKEHYGVRVSEKRYTVHYNVFASNLMPEVTITEK